MVEVVVEHDETFEQAEVVNESAVCGSFSIEAHKSVGLSEELLVERSGCSLELSDWYLLSSAALVCVGIMLVCLLFSVCLVL